MHRNVQMNGVHLHGIEEQTVFVFLADEICTSRSCLSTRTDQPMCSNLVTALSGRTSSACRFESRYHMLHFASIVTFDQRASVACLLSQLECFKMRAAGCQLETSVNN
jgi:hypothetical protein